jgi:hypothetical protein
MARPTKQTVDYFSHDCDMRNDIKIKALRRKYKHLGYSIYIITLELLGDTEYFQMKWDDTNIELLASEYDCDTDILKEIIDYCIQLNLFQIDYGYLHCPQFTKRLEDTLLVRRKDYCSNNSPISKLSLVNVNNNTQSKVKESKVNKSIVQETKLNQSIEEDNIVNQSEVNKMMDEYYEEAYEEILNEQYELEQYYEKAVEDNTDKAISYTVAKKLLADLCDWSLSFSMFEEALEEMNSIGFNKLCMLAQLNEGEIAKIKECVSIRVEQQN